jgi:monoamine oxidase
MKADVIVIGAGVAGLAAAGELARSGRRVLVLEARDRIGGRILSASPPGWPGPIELGAEFVHGTNPAFQSLLRFLGKKPRPLESCMWWYEHGQLAPVTDFWDQIAALTAKIPRRDLGWSFATFLRRRGGRLSAPDRRRALRYVASFNAGPANRISAHALRADHGGADNADGKLPGRYAAVPEALRRRWPADRVELKLRRIVTEIRWRRGHAEVLTRSLRGRTSMVDAAAAVIVTLPLGVLQAKVVRFRPALKRKQALLARLGWGDAARIVLRFRANFWRDKKVPAALRSRAGRSFGFLNIPEAEVRVWWALHPPEPVLVGWSGGPDAQSLLRKTPAQLFGAACRSLALAFGLTEKELRARVVDWRFHNWRTDPFARGAYSFTTAGLESGPAQLAEPVAGTIYFAGEATSEVLGTVHGALESGVQAARALIKSR